MKPGRAFLLKAGALLLAFALAGFVAWRQHRARVDEMKAAHWQAGLQHAVQESRRLMTFSDEIRESSGVAASRRTPGLFWTHNDSGGDPVLYGVHPDHGIVVRLVLSGAPNRDWEDIDLGPCPPPGSGSCLYVGDIGDNLRRRSRVSVLVVEEPYWDGALPPGSDWADGREVSWRRFDLAYPDGARDAEALAVTEDGEVYIVSKGGVGSIDVYGARAEALRGVDEGGLLTLESAGTLPLEPLWWVGRIVTAATDDGPELVVRTYTEVYRYRREGEQWISTGPPCFVAVLGDGGEAVDVGTEGEIYLTREATGRRPAALHVARCPAGDAGARVPSPAADGRHSA